MTPQVDGEYAGFDRLEEMDLSGEGFLPESRYGGKASNLARLQTILQGDFEKYRETGFAVPMRYYLEFLRSNRIAALADPGRLVTYEEHLAELLADPELRSDPQRRFEALARLRRHMEEVGEVPAGLASRLALRIAAVFGSTRIMARFRSSSNIEDILEFTGAGLYESSSACAADDLDQDAAGPSRCDAAEPDERLIAAALKRVWASLWSFRAYEERAFYGIPQETSAMGILVSRAFQGERANGVAFTGNPANPEDRRYVVSVQAGETSVVSPEPGVLPERDILEMKDGKVVKIIRAAASTIVPAGTKVLSDEQLQELGALLAHMQEELPLDLGRHERRDVLLDVELKVESGGELAVKQVRPFLLQGPVKPSPTFILEVPEGLAACGTFIEGRSPQENYELKSSVRFRAGRIALTTREESFEADLFDAAEGAVLVGPRKESAVPEGPGNFRVRSLAQGASTVYRFSFEQKYRLSGDRELTLSFFDLPFAAKGALPLEPARVLDGAFLRDELRLTGNAGRPLRYGSCGEDDLELWEVQMDLDDGSQVRLLERHRPPRDLVETGPAALVRAEVSLRGRSVREVTDYWHLVYASRRHNLGVRYWVELDPPMDVGGLGKSVRIVEIVAPEPVFQVKGAMRLLDQGFEEIVTASATAFSRDTAPAAAPAIFVRGDVSADGKLDLADAVEALHYLFQRGKSPPCLKAADANDDGKLNTTDAVRLLLHLFASGPPPAEPAAVCGPDPTADALACDTFPQCR